MNIRKIAVILLALAAVAGCKKEKEEEKEYVKGKVSINVPAFILENQTITSTPKGAVHPVEGKTVGYTWRVSSLMTKSDTTRVENGTGDGTFNFNMGDSLGTYTVTCSAFAFGYYSITATEYVTIVRPGHGDKCSIEGVKIDDPDEILTDAEGTEYDVVTAGGKKWMRNNLAYAGPADAPLGAGYRDYDVMSNVFGRYYSWDEAMKACPDGWHLPTDAEFLAIAQECNGEASFSEHEIWKGVAGDFMCEAKFSGEEMWEYWPDVKVSDRTRMAVLPFGYCNIQSKVFSGLYKIAAFWTADEYFGEEYSTTKADAGTDMAYYRYFEDNSPDIYCGVGHKDSFGASVRCVKD